ncbi:hypothetical protein [Sphingosinicella microcystinivorans]|uniref:DinB/UmuC family translesion DNA polymerase n=1 Tax=Sphingosinicella microcystinivorans TaxID=335406 RepID=UPI003B8451BB
MARGEDNRPVDPDRVRKSSGSETTFNRDLTDKAEIEAGVLGQADDVWAWCEKAQALDAHHREGEIPGFHAGHAQPQRFGSRDQPRPAS